MTAIFNNEEGTVTLTKEEYASLIDDSMKLNALINGGVDNWEWYGESLTEYFKWRDGDDNDEE